MLASFALLAKSDFTNFIPTMTEICAHAEQLRVSNSPHLDQRDYEAAPYNVPFTHALLLRLFRTSQGFLGFGSPSLRPGDSVWIAPGSRVPLVFRSTTEGRFRLVGATYLHGFMHEEAFKGARISGFEMVELV